MFEKFFKKKRKEEGKEKAQFDHLLMVAKKISQKNPRALPDYVNLVLRPLQAEFNLAVAERGRDAIPRVGYSVLFGEFLHPYIIRFLQCKDKERDPQKYTVRLNYHAVFPWPWNLERYIDNISMIGSHKFKDGRYAWVQDYNHRLHVWLPWGIVFVEGGNHSIMTGIAASEGELTPKVVSDYSCLLDVLHTDGVNWFDSETKKSIAEVKDYRAAAVFEIGRLMNEKNCGAELFM